MAMAEDELQKTEDLVKTLTDSKTVNTCPLCYNQWPHLQSHTSGLSGPDTPCPQITIAVFFTVHWNAVNWIFSAVMNNLHPSFFTSGVRTSGRTAGRCQDRSDQEGEWDFQSSSPGGPCGGCGETCQGPPQDGKRASGVGLLCKVTKTQ